MSDLKIKVLSYNIHKGFRSGNFGFILNSIREVLKEEQPDIIFLQEIVGKNESHERKVKAWPKSGQLDHLASDLWPHFKYGQTAVYEDGHHGNAILSRYPITASENIELYKSKWESRGLLHVEVSLPEPFPPLHAFCAHFGLFELQREKQAELVIKRIQEHTPPGGPVIFAGDLNDWRENLSHHFEEKVKMQEVFQVLHGEHAQTFPAWMPLLRLDRIYFRDLRAQGAEVHTGGAWNFLSDHAAVSARFSIASASV